MLHCAPIWDDGKLKWKIPNDKLKWLLLTTLIYRGTCFLMLLSLWSLSPALVTHWLAYQLKSLCYETWTGTFIPSVTKSLLTQSSWIHCTAHGCVCERDLMCLADQAVWRPPIKTRNIAYLPKTIDSTFNLKACQGMCQYLTTNECI